MRIKTFDFTQFPDGIVGVPYETTLIVPKAGNPPFTALVANLPPGLSADLNHGVSGHPEAVGAIGGFPTAGGRGLIQVVDSEGWFTTFSLTVTDPNAQAPDE